MRKKKFEIARVTSYKLEDSDYRLLQAYWALKGIEPGDRIRQLLQAEIDTARQSLADLVKADGA